MGQITIFEKENCSYCEKVSERVNCFRNAVLSELEKEGKKGELNVVNINCGEDRAYIVFLLRTTGTATVPHVFFNEQYMGDSHSLLMMDSVCKAGYNVLRDKLKTLALKPNPDPKFPPQPDAAIYKVTDTLAFASQPSLQQIKSMKEFGVASVLNLCRPDSPAFMKDEASIIGETDINYVEEPLRIVTLSNITRSIEALKRLPGPVVVHDDFGSNACLVVLLLAAEQLSEQDEDTRLDSATILGWGRDLGHDLNRFRTVIDQAMQAYASSSSTSSDKN